MKELLYHHCPKDNLIETEQPDRHVSAENRDTRLPRMLRTHKHDMTSDSSHKKEGRDLHVVFLNLVSAFGSIPHSLLWLAFAFFCLLMILTNVVRNYFKDLKFCLWRATTFH